MKVTVGGVAKTIGGDIWGLTKELPGFAADKAGEVWGAAKKRGTKTGQRANGIYELTQSTCQDRFIVGAKTMLPAAGKALWILLVPRPSEILEEAIQPKGKRTDPRTRTKSRTRNRKGKNGKRRKRFRGIIPNTNTLVAGVIPGAFARASRIPGPVEGAAWWAWDRAELVLYWWLILEAWDTFIYEWSSGIVEAKFCANPAELVFQGEGTNNAFSGSQLWPTESAVEVQALKNMGVEDDGRIHVSTFDNVKSLTMNMRVQGKVAGLSGDDTDIEVTARLQRLKSGISWVTIEAQTVTVEWNKGDRAPKPYQFNLSGTADTGSTFRYYVRALVGGNIARDREDEEWVAFAIGNLP